MDGTVDDAPARSCRIDRRAAFAGLDRVWTPTKGWLWTPPLVSHDSDSKDRESRVEGFVLLKGEPADGRNIW